MCLNSNGHSIEVYLDKETKIKICIFGIYLLLIIGALAPTLLLTTDNILYRNLYVAIIPGVSAVLVAWLQKSAFSVMQQRASFATPGLKELRQKYLIHVNRLEKSWLILAIYAVVVPVLNT